METVLKLLEHTPDIYGLATQLRSNSSEPGLAISKTVNSLKSLHRKDYPHVRCWTIADFKTLTSRSNNISTITVKPVAPVRSGSVDNSMDNEDDDEANEGAVDPNSKVIIWLENDRGVPVNKQRRSVIRKIFKEVFCQLELAGMDPVSWASASITAINYVREQMTASVPKLRLCANHWKIDKLATTQYPFFCRDTRGKNKIKTEPSDSAVSSGMSTNAARCKKRGRGLDKPDSTKAKKMKIQTMIR